MAEPRVWAKFRRVAYSAGACDPSLPTAAFDFDSTLRPYRGRGPPEELTLRFLAKLAGAFNLVVVSNRSSPDPAALAPLRAYAASLDAAGARATFYAPTARDRDRKPHTGVWEHYLARACAEAELEGAPSRPGSYAPPFAFYCGDAAGRPGDFSAADLLFAHNNGLAFLTPEALFFGGDDPWAEGARLLEDAGALSPGRCFAPAGGAPDMVGVLALLPSGRKTCVILVGSPASGKSRVAAQLAGRGYEVASRDTQGAGYGATFAAALRRGADVAVDNTHPSRAGRREVASAAQNCGYRVILCHVATPKALCFHLNGARCQLDPTGRTPELPAVAIHTYWKRREAPDASEAAEYGGALLEVPFAVAVDAPPEVTQYRYASA